MSGRDPMWGERQDPPLLERLRRWWSPIEARADINPSRIVPLVSITLGYRRADGSIGADIAFGERKTQSLFYNGAFFLRLMLPFFVGIGIRWRGRGEGREFLQCYLPGWKLNGQFAAVPRFRIQSDGSAARGTTGPNFGQAVGWAEGTK